MGLRSIGFDTLPADFAFQPGALGGGAGLGQLLAGAGFSCLLLVELCRCSQCISRNIGGGDVLVLDVAQFAKGRHQCYELPGRHL